MASLDFIPNFSLQGSLLLPALAGLATYRIYKALEITPANPVLTLLLLFAAPLASTTFLLNHYPRGVAVPLGFSAFYGTLLSSIVIYRISLWHPLAKYPGPFFAKMSQFWLARMSMTGKWHETLQDLHEQYGTYVRIGPNQLSFVDASLIPKIMGPDGMPKGPIFDGMRIPGVPANVFATRSFSDHVYLRKPWTKGLSSASVKAYTPTIVKRAVQLADELEKASTNKGKNGKKRGSVDLSMWLSWFAFDFMGDMVFGGGFELMKEGDTTGIWKLINEQMKAQNLFQHLPWAVRIVHKLPGVVAAMAKFTTFVKDCVSARFSRGPRGKALFYHIADEDEASASGLPRGRNLALLIENCKVAIIAGSDTTATTLSNMFYYLLTNKDVLQRLRGELDEVFPVGEGDPNDFTKLSELPVLNAVINETLRLQPPLPTDLQRAPAAGSGRKQIGDHILLEGTAVNIPPYVLHRQARYFSDPNKFWIDRWLQPFATTTSITSSSLIHDTSAYIPFSYGPASCAGKVLALAEIRFVAALLLQRFDIEFEEEYDTSRWEKELFTYFVFSLGELPVVLRRRG